MKKNVLRYASLLFALVMLCSSLTLLSGCTSKEDTAAQSDSAYVSIDDVASDVKVVDKKTAIKAVIPYAESLGLTDPEKELKVSSVNTVGEEKYYRMQQYYEDVPVYGRTVVVGAEKNGEVAALTSNTVAITGIDTVPNSSKEKIVSAIEKFYNGEVFVEEITDDKLYIFNLDDTSDAKLVYVLSVATANDVYNVIVDADNAEVIKSYSAIQFAQKEFTQEGQNGKQTFEADASKGTNKMTYTSDSGTEINVYVPIEEYTWYNDGNATLVSWKDGKKPDKSAVDAMANMTKTYTFFNKVLNVDSYDRNGGDINVYVHITGYGVGGRNRDYTNNAFHVISPNGTVFAFTKRYDQNNNEISEYSADLDVVAHEYMHGVEARISGMVYEGESGAIMEAYSDLFGEIAEDYSNDGKLDGDCSWSLIDRNLINPNGNSYPDYYKDEFFADTVNRFNENGVSINDNGGVHTNNTVLSHAAYLMWNGINGTESKKIDTKKLAWIWYRALQLMQADANFVQCAENVYRSAKTYRGITDEQLQCVKEAFEAVGIFTSTSSSAYMYKGSKLYVEDTNFNRYGNYHLKIYSLQDLRNPQMVLETDVTDSDGYVVNLDAGTYQFVVTDNDAGGSKKEYSKTVRIIDYGAQNLQKSVVINTDFGGIAAKDFTIPKELVVTLGELGVIEPEIAPVDATGYSIKWTSSDESVATVTPTGENGIITTLKKGTTTITATMTSGGKTITKKTTLRVASKARDTVLVLDISGSMSGTPLEEMKEAAIQFCNDLLKDEYNNRVGLVFYETTVTTVDLTDDLDMLISRIRSVWDVDMTNMEGGLAAADAMLKNSGRADAIKNVVIMADGLPNEGKTSLSGSMPDSGIELDTSFNDMYSNAVIDTAKDMMKRYNLYSLGFFHKMNSDTKQYTSTLMKELTNQKDGYYQVDNAEDLKFAFGDIQEEISVGSKIVINIACPVDVKVSYKGEVLSSAKGSFKGTASFGSLQLLGKNKDIKVVSLDSDKDYDIELTGTGTGEMDYSVSYFDEAEQRVDHRSFESVPITPTTVIKSSTDTKKKDITLDVDSDGDGEIDTIWTAAKKSKGTITYEKNPPVKEEPTEPADTNDNNDVLLYAVVGVLAVFVLIGGMAALLLTGSKKKTDEIEIPIVEPIVDEELPEKEEFVTEDKERTGGTIQITSGSMNGFAVPIRDGETLHIGKDRQFANIVLTNDYHKVSRMHCSVTYDAGNNRYYVTDCSSNGTYYANKTRLEKGKRTLVNANSVLLLANEECTIWLS